MFSHGDPNIVQYQIMSDRSEGNAVNLGEAKAAFGFTWGFADGVARRPDPRYVTFNIYLAKRNRDYTESMLEPIEFDYINEE